MLIDVITMGCSKNLVDSERLLKLLENKGYQFRHDPQTPAGDYVVVNTCGFIADAKEESINLLLELGEAKSRGDIGKLVVMGCLSERYMDELKELLPEVDIWYGKFDWKSFVAALPDLKKTPDTDSAGRDVADAESPGPECTGRVVTTPAHSAYVKISEGCNRFCAFCAIPLITGRHTSRSEEDIIEEVRELAAAGVKEFNIIAQDLSSYGLDLYGEHRLAHLVTRMAEIEGVEWIRLHYAYPADFPYDILDVIRDNPKVCAYLDIALQHISDKVLTNMRRHISREETLALIREIRSRVPGICLRTTLMVGFPGEGEQEYRELLDFVRQARFDRMGAFAYSEEEDTWAARNLVDDIPEETKQSRLNSLMELQERIAAELNEALVGREMRVLVDQTDGNRLVCRSEYDSPDVDQIITVETDEGTHPMPQPGDFINVRITEALPFELLAEMI